MMSLLRGTGLPRIMLGIFGVLALTLAWGSLGSLVAYGPSMGSVLMLVIALALAAICLSVAVGRAPFHIRE